MVDIVVAIDSKYNRATKEELLAPKLLMAIVTKATKSGRTQPP
jgi:hypothetical protein